MAPQPTAHGLAPELDEPRRAVGRTAMCRQVASDAGPPPLVRDAARDGRREPGWRERDGGEGPGRQPVLVLQPGDRAVPVAHDAVDVAEQRIVGSLHHDHDDRCMAGRLGVASSGVQTRSHLQHLRCGIPRGPAV